MKESKFTPEDRRIIFRETFNSEFDCRRNSGQPTDVIFSKGQGEFNGTSSSIAYPIINGTYTLRFVLNIPVLQSAYLMDWSNASISGDGYFILINDGTFTKRTGGTNYVNGVASNNYTTNTTEIVISGFTTTGELTNMYVGSRANNTTEFLGSIDLIEIYRGTLTAEEVSNLYEGKRFKAITGQDEILNVSAQSGTIFDRQGNTLTNTNVEVFKDG